METDAKVTARIRRNPDAERAITALAREMRDGDMYSRKRAETFVRDFATARELAAIKRHLQVWALGDKP